jgi:hypothetical protein
VTAIAPAPPAALDGGAAARVPWRRLVWVIWRRHRAALAAFVALAVLIAIAMAVTGSVLHPYGHHMFSAGSRSPWPLFERTYSVLEIVLPLVPVLAGLFLGAPLVARDFETGTARFTWAQSAGRTRYLLAAVVPVALLLAIIAVGLGLEFRWWAAPLLGFGWPWRPGLLSLNPPSFVGWLVFGFSLGVFLGTATRRAVPAMAATLACYAVLWYQAAISWRHSYLPPLHRPATHPSFFGAGASGYGMSYGPSAGGAPGPDVRSAALGWPDGRLLTGSQINHTAAWFRQHHIQVWLTYQPASRWALFQWIEFGWLTVLSALLIAVAIILIRRRAA